MGKIKMHWLVYQELKKAAIENTFYASLLKQYDDGIALSEKQMAFVKKLSEKKMRAIKNTKKLTEF